MKIVDVMGKTCPVPVMEARKALAEQDVDSVLVKVDNIDAVQNLEMMAKSCGHSFSYTQKGDACYEVVIDGKKDAPNPRNEADVAGDIPVGTLSEKLVVVISRDTMGEGAEELGKILIKGFIYSLTELAAPPQFVIFLNSGAYLTAEGASTVEDLKRLEERGTGIFTCGTCAGYYGLKEKLAVGKITDMYGITERMAGAAKVINI